MREQFLADIREHPDDDTPRLVMADWLEENGDPDRAAFIRTQCALAALPHDDLRVPALRKKEEELLAAHKEDWIREEDPDQLGIYSKFQRGLLTDITATVNDLRDRVDTALRFPPAAQVVRLLVRSSTDFSTMARLPNLSRFTHLDASNVFLRRRECQILELLDSRNLGHLRELSLYQTGVTDELITRIATHPRMGLLHTLDVSGNDLGNVLLRLLTRSPVLPSLQQLYVGDNLLTAEGMEALLHSELIGRLRHLTLHTNEFGDTGIAALALPPRLGQLQYLDLYETGFSVDGVEALRNMHSPALRTLDVGANALGPEDVEELLRADWMATLRKFSLDENPLGNAGLNVIASHKGHWNIADLHLGNTGVTHEGIRLLASSGKLKSVRSLHLSGNAIGDDGTLVLSQAQAPYLSDMYLQQTGVSENAVHVLLRSPNLGLRRLWIDEASVELQALARQKGIELKADNLRQPETL